MKTLIEKIAAYELCVQTAIDKIKQFESECIENVPEEFLSDLGFKCFYDEWVAAHNGNVIPSDVNRCGQFGYWGGDFCKPFTRASRKQVVEFAKGLPALIEKAEKLAEKRLAEVEDI